jgi:hypothetical protein
MTNFIDSLSFSRRLHLYAKNRIIAKELVSIDSLTSSIVHPGEVFKGAILNNKGKINIIKPQNLSMSFLLTCLD